MFITFKGIFFFNFKRVAADLDIGDLVKTVSNSHHFVTCALQTPRISRYRHLITITKLQVQTRRAWQILIT